MKILKEITKEELKDFLYEGMDLNDISLYKEANDPNKIGIFQMNGNSASFMINKIKPKNFDELNACNAFARPGTIDFADSYVENRDKKISPYPKIIQELLSETNQICLYQEQVMEIFHKIGNFTLAETDEVRSLMKKLGKAEKKPEDVKKWEKVVKKFKKGAEINGITAFEAENVANDLLKMSSYSFNKSHSTAYTYIAVMTLYLSIYFRKYFYSSVLQYEIDRDDNLIEIMNSIKNHGFKILPPDINISKEKVSPLKDNDIILGITNVKSVGEKAAEKILEEKPYENIFDFIIKTRSRQVNSACIKNLIKFGVFDNMINKERKKYLIAFNNFWEKKGTTKVREKLEALWGECVENASNTPFIETKQSDFIKYEKEALGFNFFTSPFTDKRLNAINELYNRGMIYRDFKQITSVSKKIAVSVGAIRTLKDKNDNLMAFIEIEDMNGNRESIPVFSSYWKFVSEKIISSEGKIILMNIFRDDNEKLLFGQKGFIKESSRILRMIKEMP